MADEYSWTGNGAAGDWNDPNNWTDITNPSNTGGVPGAGDYVEFDTDAQLNAPGAVGQWIDIEANVSLNGGSITPTEQVGSPLIIGESGTGSLTLTGGATGNIVSSNGNGIVWDGVAIAVLGGSAGTLILTGASTLTTTGAFAGDGTSVITISGGAQLTVNSAPTDPTAYALSLDAPGTAYVPSQTAINGTGTGLMTVGSGSSLIVNAGGLGIGGSGAGYQLLVTAGGTVTVNDTNNGIIMAPQSYETSLITVTGQGATLTDTGILDAGYAGNAIVTVSQGATVSIGAQNSNLAQDASVLLGDATGSTGYMFVTDANTTVTVNGQVDIGADGTGILIESNGASMTTGDPTGGTISGIDIGYDDNSIGALIVQGSSTTLTNTGQFTVGDDGNGLFIAASGAQVTTSINSNLDESGFEVASGNGSTGTVYITGQGTSLTASDIDLISDGTATVTVSAGAQVTDSGDFNLDPLADGTVNFTVTDPNTLLSVAGTVYVGGQGGGIATLNLLNGATLDPPDLIIAPYVAPAAANPTNDPNTGFSLDYVQTVNVGTGATLHVNQIIVGQAGHGLLTTNGGTIIADDTVTIGDQSTAQGRLIVDGDDASLEGADMTVGNDGKGLLSIGNGNDVTTDGDATIGANADGTGSVLVGDGTGTGAADWEISGTLTDGGAGKGVLTVADSDLSVGGDFVIGDQAGSNGQATFTAGSLSMDGGTITVGNQGKGSLLFQTGSTLAPGDDLNVPSVIIGEVLGASGTMTVTDAGTSVEIDDLTVGDAGTGSLKVAAGGQLQVDGTADIGAGVVGAIQNLTLDTQGLMSVVGDLSLGEAGIVAVNVKNGAQLAGDSNVTLGEDAGSSAAVTVTGVFTPESGSPTPSGLGFGLTLTVGDAGIGNLTISSGALVAPTPGGAGVIDVAAQAQSQGTVTLSGTGSQLQGTTLYLGGTADGAGGLGKMSVATGSTVSLSAEALLYADASLTLSGGTFSAAALTIDNAASASGHGTIDGPVTDDGGITVSGGVFDLAGALSGTGTAVIKANSTLELGDGASGAKIQFKGSDATLKIGDSGSVSSTISGFTFGDTIDLVGVTATSAEDTKGTLDVYDDTTLVDSFKVSGNYKDANFDVNPSADGSAITLDPSQPSGLPVVTSNPITISVPQSIEGAAGTAVNVNGLSVSDSVGGVTITVELLTTTGLLSANTGATGGGGTITNAPDGTGLIITGTLDQVNADLTTVTYTATAAGADTIEAFASDTANDADGDSTAVTISDEAPTLMVPGAQTVTAGTATPITGTDITDPLSTGATFTVTLSDSTGTLSADEDGASTTTGDGTSTLTISGDLADVNSDLASLAYTGASTGFAATATDTIAISVDDGNGGNAQGTIGVTIDQALDETPVVEAPTSEFATAGTLLAITGVSLVGSDTPENSFTVIVSADSGTLGDTAFGASTVSGSGSGYLTISGDYADVNSDLSALTYIGAAPSFGALGTDTIGFSATDIFGLSGNASTSVQVTAPGFFVWTLPIDGSFGDATNWTPNGIPDAEATAVFSSGIYTVSGTGTAGAVQVAGTPTFTGAISVDGLAGTSQAVAIADGGALTVSGGSLTTTGSVDVAQGSLTLNNGATGNFSGNGDAGPTYALQIGIAQYNSGSFYGDGTITVDGSGTTLTTDTGIVVGAGGSGTLTISNGAAVSTGDTLGAALAQTDIGDVGEGTVTVTGTGSSLTTAAPLVIAAASDSYGSLTIADGATVTSDAGNGDYAGIVSPEGYSEGNVTIEGAGSEWTVEQNLALGLESSAYVTLQDGGVLAVDGTAIVADAGGTLNLSGAGTALEASNAAMTMQDFSLVIDSASSVSLASLTLQEYGSLFLGLGSDAAEASSNLTLANTLAVNGGRVELNQGSADIGQITISDGGNVQIGSAVVDLSSAVTMDGGTFDELDGAPSAGFILTGGVNLVYTDSPVAMTFTSGADADLVTQSTDITSVSGFALDDTLDLTDIYYTSGTTATLGQNNVLTISTLYETYQVQLAPDENFNGLNFVVNNDPTHGGVDVRLTTEPGLTFTWAQPVDGSFDDAANWTPAGGPPGPEQTAVFGAGTYTVTGPGTAGQIEVDGTTTLAGAFTALGDSASTEAFTVDQGGNTTLATGASLTVGDDADTVAAVIGDLSTGAFTVDAQATFTDYGDLIVGNAGSGTLNISSGIDSAVTISGSIEIGAQASASGTISVAAYSALDGNGNLDVGGTDNAAGGTGNLVVTDAGFVSVTDLNVWGSGTVELGGGTLEADLISVSAGGVITGDGSIYGDVSNAGTIYASQDTLDFEGSVSGGTFAIDPNATLELDYTVSSGTTVQFDGLTGTLQIDDFADGAESAGQQDFNAAIAGLQVGDLIQISLGGLGSYISGIDGASPESYDSSTQTTTLDLTDSGTEVATLTLDGDYSASIFNVTASADGNYVDINDETAPCYCAGTLILTEHGQRAVETLGIGDRVVTHAGVSRAIKWIGRRSYRGRFVLGRKDILPVCIKAGALDDNVPKRDLWISPNHAMYLDGVLIEAKDLINGVSIVRAESVEQIEYFHIELDSHDVILAEGAPSESFIDDDSRGMFQNVHQYRALYPDALAIAGARYCAPRLDEGYEVETIRQRIALRAGLLPSDQTTRAGHLRGFVDRVTPHIIEGWARNAEYPEAPVCLDIFAGDRLIGQVLANHYRKDLEHAGLGSGCHAFSFSPARAMNVALDAVEVRRSLDGALLPRSVQAEDAEFATAA